MTTVAKGLIIFFIPESTTQSNGLDVVDHLGRRYSISLHAQPAQWFVHELNHSSLTPSHGMVSGFFVRSALVGSFALAYVDAWHGAKITFVNVVNGLSTLFVDTLARAPIGLSTVSTK